MKMKILLIVSLAANVMLIVAVAWLEQKFLNLPNSTPPAVKFVTNTPLVRTLPPNP